MRATCEPRVAAHILRGDARQQCAVRPTLEQQLLGEARLGVARIRAEVSEYEKRLPDEICVLVEEQPAEHLHAAEVSHRLPERRAIWAVSAADELTQKRQRLFPLCRIG